MKIFKVYTHPERTLLISQWRASGLALPAFSLESGVILTSLRYWVYSNSPDSVRRAEKPVADKKELKSFLPIDISADTNTPVEITLDFPKDVRLTIRGHVDSSIPRT